MKHIIQTIEHDAIPCYFISPHLDDAILSAGGLISHLSKKTKVTLISIFTEATDAPYTHAAKKFLQFCGFTNAKELFRVRRTEDISVCTKAGITPVHLGFIDGSFRTRQKKSKISIFLGKYLPELIHLYPLGFKLFKIAKQDRELSTEIQKKLRVIIPQNQKCVIFCPVGSVKHMDHVLTKDICCKTFVNLIFWADYPYLSTKKAERSLKKEQFKPILTWGKNLELKKTFIAEYKTQLTSLFPKGNIPLISEVYYSQSKSWFTVL